MHNSISFRLRNIPASDALLSSVAAIALYGKGTFTTIRFCNRKPSLWEKHWKRLTLDAFKIGIDISEFSEEVVLDALHEIIAKNEVANGRARITFLDESLSKIWSFNTGRKTSLLITTADNHKPSGNFRLAVSPYHTNTTSPLVGIKSCNYLEHLMAFNEAKARGFDEAVRINERGELSSACMANVFWLKERKLYTPNLKTGCLPGTTREYVVENLDCVEVEASIAELHSADAIFLTSAGIGVVQVAEFDGRVMRREPHGILDIVPKPI